MKKNLLMPMIFLAVLGCTKHHAVESNVIHVRSSTAEILSIKSYDIPKGIFRGVLWPSPDNGVFTAWGILNGKEIFYDIPAPREAIGWESQSTDKWKINETRTQNGVECTLSNNDTRTITLDLPISNKPYSFGVLKKPSGEETIILMDISEKFEGKGTVGIVVIK